jgi:hypothetical protein
MSLTNQLVTEWPINDSSRNIMKPILGNLLIGLSIFFAINATATVRYVDLNCTNATPPYADWSTAATNIQDAVDVASTGDLVLVTNGNYQTGGRLAPPLAGPYTNRVYLSKAITLQSVNGPELTKIFGYLSSDFPIRCVYLTNGAVLSGFTLTNGEPAGVSSSSKQCMVSNCVIIGCVINGANGCTLNNCTITGNTGGPGGGVESCTLSNCTLIGNTASSFGGGADNSILNNCLLLGNTETGTLSTYGGGGARASTLNNCTVIGNKSASVGGGVFLSTLNSCLVFSNSASIGGGASSCTLNNCTIISNSASSAGGGTGDSGTPKSVLNNCIVYYNAAPTGSNYFSAALLNFCSTASLPTNGVGNITNEPVFADLIGGNFHLQSNSPCINAGKNSYVTNSTDLDGNPRIVGGTVDIGAYEYQTPSSILSYAWAQQYGLPTDGTADYANSDGTGMNNWQKWIAGLNPTNPASVLQMASPSNSISGIKVTWQSVNTRTYFLQRGINLSASPAFSSIQSNLVGQAGSTSYTDTTATNGGPFFYRVGVQ